MSDKSMDATINVEFEEAASRQQINSGEDVSTLFGKIRKFFADLKSVAFSGSYNDLSDRPSEIVGATSSDDGIGGLVPTPIAGTQDCYLRGDGTWATPPGSEYTLPTASKDTLGGVTTTSSVTSNSGYTACPIISGVPYYKDTNTLPYQFNTTADGEYRLLLSYNANDNSYNENYLRKSGKFTANPSTGTLSATTFKGDLDGDAATVNGHTINADVPADAVFTDTVMTVDSDLSSSSTNPVQNQAVYTAVNARLAKSGGTMTGTLKAYASTSYTTAQVRNITMSTSAASGGSSGQVHFKYS